VQPALPPLPTHNNQCINKTSTGDVSEHVSRITAGPVPQATDVEALLWLSPVWPAVHLIAYVPFKCTSTEAVSAT
jgi:hypothetical protein